jgi:hypothetical protein
MHYNCDCCGKPIGLMADKNGRPEIFLCPTTGGAARPQTPVKRETPRLTLVGKTEVPQQRRTTKEEDDE